MRNRRRYWRGYFAGEQLDAAQRIWLPCVWELTEHSELDLRDRYERGQVWAFERPAVHGKKHPPVSARLVGLYTPAVDYPLWDYRPVLMSCYHTATIDCSVSNPMPPRLLVPASPADVPYERLEPLESKQAIGMSEEEKQHWRELRSRNGTAHK